MRLPAGGGFCREPVAFEGDDTLTAGDSDRCETTTGEGDANLATDGGGCWPYTAKAVARLAAAAGSGCREPTARGCDGCARCAICGGCGGAEVAATSVLDGCGGSGGAAEGCAGCAGCAGGGGCGGCGGAEAAAGCGGAADGCAGCAGCGRPAFSRGSWGDN